MGTRGLTVVLDKDSNIKIAQYGQWDHYPIGQGWDAMEFARNKENLNKLSSNLDKCKFIDQHELDDLLLKFTEEGRMMTDEESDLFLSTYPSLTRDTGAKILDVVANATDTVPLVDSTDFANDTLFCEGVYTINFSTNTFTAWYNGIQKTYDLDGYTLRGFDLRVISTWRPLHHRR